MGDEKNMTEAGAVELEEDALDQASGGVNKIDAITIKQKVNEPAKVSNQIGTERDS